LDVAILEGIRTVLDENAPLLVRNDRKWIRRLAKTREAFKNPAHAKPDVAGQQNLSALEKMHEAIEKAVAETS
jgi:hypothetical protein